MESSRSPEDVMVLAHRLGCKHLSSHASEYSRRDHATLPQPFAWVVLRQFHNLRYRRAEALRRDATDLRDAIGNTVCPDHNTLCDAFDKLATIDAFAPMRSDHAQLDTPAYHAWRRAPARTVVAHTGYDSELNHELLRLALSAKPVISRATPIEPFHRRRPLWS